MATILGLMALALVIGGPVLALAHYRDGAASARIQHGVPAVLTVVDHRTVAHHGRSTTYTTVVDGVLDEPGAPASVLTTPGRAQGLTAGERLAVLHAPDRPAVSELPGRPNATRLDAVGQLLFVLAVGGFALLFVVKMVRRRLGAQLIGPRVTGVLLLVVALLFGGATAAITFGGIGDASFTPASAP